MLMAGCATQDTIYDRPGVTGEQVKADYLACTDPNGPPVATPALPPQKTLEGAAMAGVATGVAEVSARHRNAPACMAGLGYESRELTPEEKKAISAAPNQAARDQVLTRIRMSND